MQVLRNENDSGEVGQNLKVSRKEEGLSQDELADLMGTSRNDVYRHETGKCEMSMGTLFQYADAFGGNLMKLVPSRFRQDPAAERLAPLTEIASGLSDESLQMLIDTAKHLQKLESKMQQN